MRARYYSPDMRRFINADVIPGTITNAVTLNRFAFANSNPVSFVDPSGLDADSAGDVEKLSSDSSAPSSSSPNYTKAIFVCNRNHDYYGLPLLGHTQLYFLSTKNGKETWYFTEFAYSSDKGAFINDIPLTGNIVPPMYDEKNKKLITVDDIDYVVLEGDFDKSVDLAKSYAGTSYGGYNLFTNNCSDYTDEILRSAIIDDESKKLAIETEALISIPIIREWHINNSEKVIEANESVLNLLHDVNKFFNKFLE